MSYTLCRADDRKYLLSLTSKIRQEYFQIPDVKKVIFPLGFFFSERSYYVYGHFSLSL